MSDKEILEEDELTEEDSTIILLSDEDNNEIPFEFLDLVEYENGEYVVLLPLEESEEDDEVIILKLETTNEEEESYIGVDDEEVLETVFEIFKQRNNDRYNFVD